MSTYYSQFPEEIDHFMKKYDLQASDLPKFREYQDLKLKSNRTPTEDARLAQLTNDIGYALIDPDEWNKFQDALVSMQVFVKDRVEGYMDREVGTFTFIDEYNPTVQYQKRNTISYRGDSYICQKDTIGNAPNPDPNINRNEYWARIAQRGAKGDQGVPGTGLRYKGVYNPSAQYFVDDAVQFGGQIFACLQDNIGQEPDPNRETTYWSLAVSRGQSTKVTEFKKRYTLTRETVNIPIGIPEFNRTTDSLTVIQNSVVLTEEDQYTINPNGSSIDKTDGIWNGAKKPIYFEFKVLKNFVTDVTYHDGTLIQDGTVSKEKLKQDVQDKLDQIGDLSQLQTTYKDDLVGSVNELFTGVDSLKSGVRSRVIDKGGTVEGTRPNSNQELFDGIESIPQAKGNATRADVLAGKTFSSEVAGIEQEGTMPNRGAVNQTLTSQGQQYTIPQGYHSGNGRVQVTLPVMPSTTQNLTKQNQEYTIPQGYHSGQGKVRATYPSAEDITQYASVSVSNIAYPQKIDKLSMASGYILRTGTFTNDADLYVQARADREVSHDPSECNGDSTIQLDLTGVRAIEIITNAVRLGASSLQILDVGLATNRNASNANTNWLVKRSIPEAVNNVIFLDTRNINGLAYFKVTARASTTGNSSTEMYTSCRVTITRILLHM